MGFIVTCWLIMAALCAAIAIAKGRSAMGWFLLGFLFGPLALLFAAAMSSARKSPNAISHPVKACPYCAEQVHADAIRCKHCGQNLAGAIEHQPMKDQWREEFEKQDGKKTRWGSSPNTTD
ncbi:hypothetical protein EGJ28_15965 [Stutzerimonas xanthomarina]|uniref:Zinc ribbon domain-containing protein n=1 Tax=Stutzerimonas xanthomarina TaxID=271420 RepID=A0A427DYA9_9GAMM|nr:MULTISPECIES: hypothetical protein [Stutzerimonas]RRV08766.1 hypothetical protein EGJ28_15965 [Stutzerimonas xanthomarina]